MLLIEVLDIDENGITAENKTKYTRERFAEWFRKINRECLADKRELIKEIYNQKNVEDIGKITLKGGKYMGETIESVYIKDVGYLEWLKSQEYPYSKAVLCYLNKMEIKEKMIEK